LAKAPFVWNYFGTDHEMQFVGGLIGITQDPATLCLRPEIGWAILDKQRITQIEAERARVEAEKAKVQAEKEAREKAQVVAPRFDPFKPRFEQYFKFVCPFCRHGEEIGLWCTSKMCASCQKTSRIIRKP
jgi:hypothetical protein